MGALAPIVRIDLGNVEVSLDHIDSVFKTAAPDRPPRARQFLDEAFDESYAPFASILTHREETPVETYVSAI